MEAVRRGGIRVTAKPDAPYVVHQCRQRPGDRGEWYDVREFVTPDSLGLTIDHMTALDPDDIALHCLRWVAHMIVYESDRKRHKVSDWWQRPSETIARWHGDCEDGALPLASMLIACGIPRNRVFVCVGHVTTWRGSRSHAWVAYYREKDSRPVALDWCFGKVDTTTPIAKRRSMKWSLRHWHRNVRFWFNDKVSGYGKLPLKVRGE
jgi:predicted transglutaminase-like cysteine proteinase